VLSSHSTLAVPLALAVRFLALASTTGSEVGHLRDWAEPLVAHGLVVQPRPGSQGRYVREVRPPVSTSHEKGDGSSTGRIWRPRGGNRAWL
jgi:hypothetical protein